MEKKSSLIEFAQKYFNFPLKINWHHKLFYLILDNLVYQKEDRKLDLIGKRIKKKPGSIYVAKKVLKKVNNRNILILSPRFHSKSTVFSFVYPIYEILHNPNVRILVLSANTEIAKSFVRQVLQFLDNNEDIIRDFGNLQPTTLRKWGEKAFIVKRTSTEKDPTMSASGIMERIISKRADIIILDDIVDLERTRTKEQRDKVFDWFANVVYPILDPDHGRLIVSGTVWNKDDIYHRMMANSTFDVVVKLKSLIYDSKVYNDQRYDFGKVYRKNLPYKVHHEKMAQDINEVVEDRLKHFLNCFNDSIKYGVLWHDKWSYEKLVERRKVMGENAFLTQFMNEPISEHDVFFKKTYIDAAYQAGKPYRMPHAHPKDLKENDIFPKLDLITMMGVDFAISTREKSDYSSIAIFGLDLRTSKRYLLHLEKLKVDITTLKQKIIELYHTYRCVKCVVESNVFQDIIRQDLQSEINVVGHKTTAFTKFDVERGLSHMQLLFEQGRIIIPSKSYMSQGEILKSYYNDLVTFTLGDHTPDTVIASWLSLIYLKEYDESVKKEGGFLPQKYLLDSIEKTEAATPVIILKNNFTKVTQNSVLYFYHSKNRFVAARDLINTSIKDKDIFGIVFQDKRAYGYFFDKKEKTLVSKIQGVIDPHFFVDLIFQIKKYAKTLHLCVFESDEVFFILDKKDVNLFFVFEGRDGLVHCQKRLRKTDIVPSYYINNLKLDLISEKHKIKDMDVLSSLSSIISFWGDEPSTQDGSYPYSAILYAIGYGLLDLNKQTGKSQGQKNFKPYKPTIPYKIFNYQTY